MSKNKQCASCSYIAQDENREGWCELHQTSTTVTEWCPDYHQKKTAGHSTDKEAKGRSGFVIEGHDFGRSNGVSGQGRRKVSRFV